MSKYLLRAGGALAFGLTTLLLVLSSPVTAWAQPIELRGVDAEASSEASAMDVLRENTSAEADESSDAGENSRETEASEVTAPVSTPVATPVQELLPSFREFRESQHHAPEADVFENQLPNLPLTENRLSAIAERKAYRKYQAQLARLVDTLSLLNTQLVRFDNDISLQRLAAVTQEAAIELQELERRFTQQAGMYTSFQKALQAVHILQDVVGYWQQRLRYQAQYRASEWQVVQDDEWIANQLRRAQVHIADLERTSKTQRDLEHSAEY